MTWKSSWWSKEEGEPKASQAQYQFLMEYCTESPLGRAGLDHIVTDP